MSVAKSVMMHPTVTTSKRSATIKYSMVAFLGGCLLAVQMFLNGVLAETVPAMKASLFVHIVGLLTALGLCLSQSSSAPPASVIQPPRRLAWWVYSAGAFGGIAIACMSVSVSSPLGTSGAVVFIVLGQILYGACSDAFGLLGAVKRRLTRWDLVQIICLIVGAVMVIV